MRKAENWMLAGTALMVLLLMGFWHGLEVRAAAHSCGDFWLTGLYVFLGAGISVSSLLAFWMLKQRNIHLQAAVPALVGLMGIFYLFVLPPFSAPDEVSHYIGSYQLSSRLLGRPSNDFLGYVLVRPEDIWMEDITGISEYVRQEDGTWKRSQDSGEESELLGQILSEDVYRIVWETGFGAYQQDAVAEGLKQKELETDAWISSRFPPVVTTPLVYLPQAVGIATARLLGLGTIPLLYLGRFMNLFCFSVLLFWALKRLPFGQEVMAGVSLLPMTLRLAASYSYDAMIMGCMFLLTAICLDLTFQKERADWRDVLILALIAAVAGPCKMIYTVLLGLCFLIPVRRFGSLRGWCLSAGIVAAALIVSMVLVNGQVIASYAAETEAYVSWAGEEGYSLRLLIHRPYLLIRMFYETLVQQAEDIHLMMLGSRLGNMDEFLNVPYLVLMVFSWCLLELAFQKQGEGIHFLRGQRFWIWMLCAGCAAAAMLSMLIAWTPMSAPFIYGVHGRYFLPFLPVFLMTLKNDLVILTKNRNRSILYLMYVLNAYILLRLFASISMRI